MVSGNASRATCSARAVPRWANFVRDAARAATAAGLFRRACAAAAACWASCEDCAPDAAADSNGELCKSREVLWTPEPAGEPEPLMPAAPALDPTSAAHPRTTAAQQTSTVIQRRCARYWLSHAARDFTHLAASHRPELPPVRLIRGTPLRIGPVPRCRLFPKGRPSSGLY